MDNTSSPISALPNELLLQIFGFAGGDGSVCINSTRARIGRVCKQWRAVSRTSPCLWTYINITVHDPCFPQPNRPPTVTKSFLEPALILSYPCPLDIVVDVHTGCRQDVEQGLFDTVDMLGRHSIRWRNFSFTGPDYVMERLDHCVAQHPFQSPELESLTLRCNDGLPGHAFTTALPNIMVTRLRNLSINFELRRLVMQWDALTSFTGGFHTPTSFYALISQTTNLEFLYLTHIGHERDSRSVEPISLDNLRHLKIANCAIVEALENIRFPHLGELSLVDSQPCWTKSTDGFVTHVKLHCSERPDTLEILLRCLRLSSPPLRALNFRWDFPQPALKLGPIFRLFEHTLTALRIEFTGGMYHPVPPFFKALDANNGYKPILPRLKELDLVVQGTSPLPLFMTHSVESMLVSRWDVHSPGVARWTRVRLSKEGEEDWDEGDRMKYETSSLSLCLQRLAQEGLDVSWTCEEMDLLDRGRQYVASLQ